MSFTFKTKCSSLDLFCQPPVFTKTSESQRSILPLLERLSGEPNGKVVLISTNQAVTGAELVELRLQPVVSIAATDTVAALNEAHDEMLRALSEYFQRNGVQRSDPPFVRYHTFGNAETDQEIGVPITEPATGRKGEA